MLGVSTVETPNICALRTKKLALFAYLARFF